MKYFIALADVILALVIISVVGCAKHESASDFVPRESVVILTDISERRYLDVTYAVEGTPLKFSATASRSCTDQLRSIKLGTRFKIQLYVSKITNEIQPLDDGCDLITLSHN